MKPLYEDKFTTIHCGDSAEVLKTLKSNSVDTCITDPPAGIAFMGKHWDKDKGGREQWIAWLSGIMAEVLRVLKPGAICLVWSLPRTSHWTGMALEDAGFEIRDCIQHLFGCLSEDTEILTINGWEHYQEDINFDPVLCYDIETEEFLFDKPIRIFDYENKYTAYHIQSDYTDQIVSKNHRCIIERDGRDIFAYAETLQCEETIPFLESLQDLPKNISNLYEGTSITKQDLFNAVHERGNERAEDASEKTSANMSMVRENVSTEITNQIECRKNLRLRLQRCLEIIKTKLERSFKENRKKRKSRLDGEINGIVLDENDGFKQSSLEGRCNLFQKKGQLYWREICALSERIFRNGSQGRLCYGTSFNNGSTFGQMPTKGRSCTSHKSRAFRQSNRKSQTVQNKSRAQTVRRAKATIREIEYKGIMWCIETKTGAFVARRNGKIFITGNSGFPKSLDVGKALDKRYKKRQEYYNLAAFIIEKRTGAKLSQTELAQYFPSRTGGLTGCVWNWENAKNVPTAEQWRRLKELLQFSDDFDWLIEQETKRWENAERKIMGESDQKSGETNWFTTPGNFDITAPTTDDAKLWDGWGTALKPAAEVWWLAMKPIEGTFAENAQKWGVAGLNIDGCRVGMTEQDFEAYKEKRESFNGTIGSNIYGGNSLLESKTQHQNKVQTQGRWPANVVLSHHPECVQRNAKDIKVGQRRVSRRKKGENGWKLANGGGVDRQNYADSNGKETVEDWACFKGYNGKVSSFVYKNAVLSFLDEPSYLLDQLRFLIEDVDKCNKTCNNLLPHVCEIYHNGHKLSTVFEDGLYDDMKHVLDVSSMLNSQFYCPLCRRLCDELIHLVLMVCQDDSQLLPDVLSFVYFVLSGLIHNQQNHEYDRLSNSDDYLQTYPELDIWLSKISGFYCIENVDEMRCHILDTSHQNFSSCPNSIVENKNGESFDKCEIQNHIPDIFLCVRVLTMLAFDISFRFNLTNLNIQKSAIDVNLNSCAVRALDEQSTFKMHGAGKQRKYDTVNQKNGAIQLNASNLINQSRLGDEGGASRFFYCAKPSRHERNEGLEDFYWRKVPEMEFGFVRISKEEWTELPERQRAQGNVHPTVKSIKLIEYLCKLTGTPTGGIVLDPFMGSGSILKAAKQTGRPAIGIDLYPENCKIAEARLNAKSEAERQGQGVLELADGGNGKC